MNKSLLVPLALLPFLAYCQPYQLPSSQSPQDFITQLYSDNTCNLDQHYSWAFKNILDENIRLTPKDEVPYLNFNPLCGCQDGELKLQKITPASPEKRSRNDTALEVFYSLSDGEEQSVVLKLIPDGTTWEIDDFIYPHTGSLKIKLQEDSAGLVKRASRKAL